MDCKIFVGNLKPHARAVYYKVLHHYSGVNDLHIVVQWGG